jgi:hypothetical protein
MRAEEPWQAPDWYRALSLPERAGATNARHERALGRLRAWRSQKPFDREEFFIRRLALDSLSEGDLLALLAEPAQNLKSRKASPHWLVVLRQAFTDPDAAEKLAPLLEKTEADHPLAGCLPAISPLLEHVHGRLQERVCGLREEAESFPLDMGTLPEIFLTNLAPLILFQISKPLLVELHVARLEGQLRGETPEERFEGFLRRLGQDGRIIGLLAKYPVLAQQLVRTTWQWADYLYEFLTHLCADWQSIRSAFALGGDPGPLVDVEAGKGDRHRRGRTVLLLRFRSGLKLLYKPSSLRVDVHFQELLAWLNDRGAQPCLRPLRLVDRGNHGWSEFVEAAPCTRGEEVVRFYQRQGGYLALLYALDAADCTTRTCSPRGSIRCSWTCRPCSIPASTPGNRARRTSRWERWTTPCGRSGCCRDACGPTTIRSASTMSGLGGQAGQMNPHRLVSWERPGTDEMRVGRRRAELPVSENRPRLGDQEAEVWKYRDAVLTGFTGMYRLLCENRAALLAERLPRFAHDETRVVLRSTNVYGLLWYESFHPDLLRDALDRDRFFDHLWLEAAQRPSLVPLIPAEQRDLWHGDIPLFRTRPDSRAVLTSEGNAWRTSSTRPASTWSGSVWGGSVTTTWSSRPGSSRRRWPPCSWTTRTGTTGRHRPSLRTVFPR